MQAATDMQIEMTKKKNEEPVKLPMNSTIISTNGLKITSKLNPDAKEFYPAYLMRQKIIREIGDVGASATLAQPLHFAHNSNVLKVIKLEGIATNKLETDVDTLKGRLELNKSKEGLQNEAVDEMKGLNKAPKISNAEGNEKENDGKAIAANKCEVEDAELSAVTEESDNHVEADVRASEEDSTDFENFEDAEGEPMLHLAVTKEANKTHMKEMKVIEEVSSDHEKMLSESALNRHHPSEDVSDEENRAQYSDQGSNETLNEYKCKEDTESVEVSELSEENELAEEEALHELPQILEGIRESAHSLCGDGEVDGEFEVEAVCDCASFGGDGDVPGHIINVEESKLCCEADTELAIGGSHAPPNTPTEVSCKSTVGKARLSKGKSIKEKDEKRKSEKRTTLRKLANLSLSLRGKTNAHHAEKSTPRSSSAAMSRTKRLSESLHNLTSGLKSTKSDSKKTEGSSRFLPRSATNIPRPPVARARNSLTRATTETNGLKYKASKVTRAPNAISSGATNTTTTTTATCTLKDAISLKSASSSEHNLATKPTVTSAKRTLSNKSANTTAEKSNIPQVKITKSKDSMGKTRPRSTHASTLRQSEAQKRRSLFPNDDAESNIELSQFLFK